MLCYYIFTRILFAFFAVTVRQCHTKIKGYLLTYLLTDINKHNVHRRHVFFWVERPSVFCPCLSLPSAPSLPLAMPRETSSQIT